MSAIAGGTGPPTLVGAGTRAEHDGSAAAAAPAAPAALSAPMDVEPDSSESRVLDAVVVCAGRWGIDKTTVDDVAREAGMSRATVYRLFPGGKSAMVELATRREVVTMLMGVLQRLERCDSLIDAVVEMLSGGTQAIEEQPALAYMRAHQPSEIRAFFSFERFDRLLGAAADLLSPALHPFLNEADSRIVVIWIARLVVSHYITPDPALPLASPEVAHRLARTHILAGLVVTSQDSSMTLDQPSDQTQEQLT